MNIFSRNRAMAVCAYAKSLRIWSLSFAWMASPLFSAAALTDGPLGKIDLTVNARATYDSNVFSMPNAAFAAHRKTKSSSLKSSSDLILSLTPAAHFTKKIKMIEIQGTLGAKGTYFLRNRRKSYVDPITTLSIDFDESLSKHVSNNAKIRFDAIFDVGQKTETTVIENDLMSYTYYSIGINGRYNHSSKFGLGTSVSYSYRDYQSRSGANAYQDVTTTPISAKAFYIYSPKLDFFTEYVYSPTRGGRSANQTLDAATHTANFGIQGDLFTKVTGSFRIGQVTKKYDSLLPSQSSLSLETNFSWKLNQKTGVGINASRLFQPSPQDRSILTTTVGLSANHRLNEKMTGEAHTSWSSSNYTTSTGSGALINGGNLKTITFGASLRRTLSQRFSIGGGFDFSSSHQARGDFDRHMLYVDVTGRY